MFKVVCGTSCNCRVGGAKQIGVARKHASSFALPSEKVGGRIRGFGVAKVERHCEMMLDVVVRGRRRCCDGDAVSISACVR